MGYFGSAFKALANDPFGEAMVPRISYRLQNGSNYLLQSGDCSLSPWTASGSLLVLDSGSGQPYGETPQLLLTTGTPGAWEKVRQTRTEDMDRFVYSALVKVFNSANTYLIAADTVVGSSSQQVGRFAWSGGVLSFTSVQGCDAAGVVDEGGGWYRIWIAGRTEGYNGVKGNVHSYALYPSAGDTAPNKGIYCAHQQLELGSGGSGPRMADTLTDGAWGVVHTTDAVKETGYPGELVTVGEGSDETVLEVNPIRVKRERRFGVVEGQQWQARITNQTLRHSSIDLAGAPIAMEVGFPQADEWALLAQGRIAKARTGTDNTITLDVNSPLADAMDGKLRRWVFFDKDLGHASELKTIDRDPDSSGYDNDAVGAGVTVTGHNYIADAEWVIEFTTATDFKITKEDGTEYTGFDITNDAEPIAGGEGWTLEKQGWDVGAGAYTAGDKFTFTTSRRRALADATTPIKLLVELLTDPLFLNLQVYDVLAGYYYDSPLYDKAAMWDAAVSNYATTALAGQWDKAEDVMKLLQGILRVINASIYSMPTGQFALWETQPNEVSAVDFNGDPERGRVSILSAQMDDDMSEVYNEVLYTYLVPVDGSEARITTVDESSPYPQQLLLTVDLGQWRVDAASVDTAGSRALSRLKGNRRMYKLQTTLAGMVIDMADPVSFFDPVLDVSETTVVREIAVDIMANTAELVCQADPVVLNVYAVVGQATVGGADLIF